MKTSYFSNIDNLIRTGYTNFVAVSGYVPEFYQELLDTDKRFRRYKELAPKKEWFWKWKDGEFDNNEYIRLYNETVLSKLNIDEVISFLREDAVILCYEKENEFCHRHLIAQWLKDNRNIDIEEFSNNYKIF